MNAHQHHPLDPRKLRGTYGSTTLSNAAHKRSWHEKVEAAIPDSKKSAHPAGNASAAEHVNDLRPLGGALRASLTSSSLRLNPNYGELSLPLFLKKGGHDPNDSDFHENAVLV